MAMDRYDAWRYLERGRHRRPRPRSRTPLAVACVVLLGMGASAVAVLTDRDAPAAARCRPAGALQVGADPAIAPTIARIAHGSAPGCDTGGIRVVAVDSATM